MDQAIRNKLRAVVTQCRKLLEEAISQELEGKYAIFAKKDQVTADPNAAAPHLNDEEKAARKDILDHFGHIKARAFKPKDALDQLIREIAFTHLNRLCAYKMMEAREVYVGGQKFREAVSRGINSNGVKFYLAEHPEDERLFNTGHQDLAYRHFLDWLGGLLSDEIGVLFNPNDPANRLHPRQKTLDEVLDLLNNGGIKPDEAELREAWPAIWSQDETIGWVYQYFTPKELREKARKESQAPRNSYELAFRNQFFTPRYVVELLTDNTLGRIWYEMCQGETRLKDQCRYLVRRPTEIFLSEGERPPRDAAAQRDDPSQEDLLQLPVHIPHRPKKDPRELKILDPACGSGHFLLYCFDLLLTIYEEAYSDPDLGPALQRDYPTLDDLRRDVPRLILANNLHGIDIDLRASQIAALALWLRCQRAYQDMGLKKDRPRITRSNFICAEPMPGETQMLKEFVDQLEPRVLGQVVEVVFDRMKLAGEAGSLLKIEEEIQENLAAARNQWNRETAPATDRRGQPLLFAQAELDRLDGGPVQGSLFDLSDITDTQFFEQAESKVIDALRLYAQHAQNGERLQRRLFVEDAVQGFAFVDLCQKRYDVVLMNPPFGDASVPSQSYIQDVYADTKGDVYKSFIECFQDRLVPAGLLGMISSRSGFFLGQSADWRERIVLRLFRPTVLADFGFGVLDAMVETAAYVLKNIDEAEDEQLTLRLLVDVTAVETDTAGRFSIPKYQRQRGGLKRHQATSELRRLIKAGYLREVLGSFRRFRADRQAIGLAPRPEPVSLPDLLCFRLSGDTHKDRTLLSSVESVSSGQIAGNTFLANLSDLSQIPGSPFAYWVSDRVRRLFRELPPFEGEGRTVRVGLQTSDDFRFVRCWWEVPPERIVDSRRGPNWRDDLPAFQTWCRQRTFEGKRWVPFAKGGEYSPFYADLHLVVNWERDGEEMKLFGGGVIRNPDFYFRPGLTWPLRAKAFSPQAMPSGSIFSVRGYAILASHKDLPNILGFASSSGFDLLFKVLLGRFGYPEFIVGVLQSLPFPNELSANLGAKAVQAVDRKRQPEQTNELNHLFVSPFLETNPATLGDLQAEIDALAFDLYGLTDTDRAAIQHTGNARATDADDRDTDAEDEPVTNNLEPNTPHQRLSHALGLLFGRWDIRHATGEQPPPPLPDPFDPLPVCPPGMLQDERGLPQTRAPASYPLRILWDGLLVDDPEHSNDIVRYIRDISEVVEKDRAAAIEQAACDILGVKELRDYFRKPGKGGFWDDHISRYSKSRRKAPIYWLLQSSKRNYAIWLYYHRHDKDILSKALVNYVEPKIRLETSRLQSLQDPLTSSGESSKETKRLAKDMERQEDFLSELRDFEDKLRRAANLHLEPDINDGVVLNIAPLHELVPWKEAKKYWDELLAGKYEWSAIGKQLREKGLVH